MLEGRSYNVHPACRIRFLESCLHQAKAPWVLRSPCGTGCHRMAERKSQGALSFHLHRSHPDQMRSSCHMRPGCQGRFDVARSASQRPGLPSTVLSQVFVNVGSGIQYATESDPRVLHGYGVHCEQNAAISGSPRPAHSLQCCAGLSVSRITRYRVGHSLGGGGVLRASIHFMYFPTARSFVVRSCLRSMVVQKSN